MADNNVFILFEEIKTALKGINGKLEASRKTSVPLTYEEENEAMYSSHHRKPNPKNW